MSKKIKGPRKEAKKEKKAVKKARKEDKKVDTSSVPPSPVFHLDNRIGPQATRTQHESTREGSGVPSRLMPPLNESLWGATD